MASAATDACGGSRRSSDSPVTVLPDPDSPISPNTSPGAIEKLTPRTASTRSLPTANAVRKFITSMRADAVTAAPSAWDP